MGEDVDDRQLHQRAQPDGGLHVVGEDQEGRAVGADLGQGEAVERSRPWHARECRNEDCGRRICRPRNRRRLRTSAASWSMARGRPSRRSARDSAARWRSAPWRTNRGSARPLASAAKLGRSASQPSGSSPLLHPVELGRRGPDARRDRRPSAPASRREACGRARRCRRAKCSRTPSGTRNCASSGQP